MIGPNGLWENRLGPRIANGAFELCHDVHQLRPDPFNAKRCPCWHWQNSLGRGIPSAGISPAKLLTSDGHVHRRWYAICGATQAQHSQLPNSTGGLFITNDEGQHWERIFDGGPVRLRLDLVLFDRH